MASCAGRPGLQLKGKSAQTFRLFNVTAICQDKTSPWVQFPTVTAMDSFTAHRQGGTKTAVPVASTEDGA